MESKPLAVSQNTYSGNAPASIKVATPDIIITTDDVLSPEIMADLIFEEIGGQEIISIARNDTINGQNVIYQPIKNLSSLYYQYNPQNIITLQKTDKEYFKNFTISLQEHIPECGSGYDIVDGKNVPNCRHIYIDPNTKNLVINVINMLPGEEVEVQIMSNTSVLDDTIY